MQKPRIGIIGFSDGEPEVHEQLKEIVQRQVDAIAQALQENGEIELVQATGLVASVKSAKEEALRMTAQDMDGVIFSYGVFSFPNFSAIAAQNLSVPILLAANLNPEWPGMVAMLAAGGALHHLGMPRSSMNVPVIRTVRPAMDMDVRNATGAACSIFIRSKRKRFWKFLE